MFVTPFLVSYVGPKWKGHAGDNCKRTLNIESERDWTVCLGAMLGDR